MLKNILIASLFLNILFLGYIISLKTPNTVDDTAATLEPKTTPETLYKSGQTYPLMRVVDGDTVVVGFENKTEYVRLIGINAPEPNDPGGPECYAQEATTHLREIAHTGLVTLFFDETQGMRDSYGRLLAYVELPDGTDLGRLMLADGYAHEYTYQTPYLRQVDYMADEVLAVSEARGLWGQDACQ